MKRAVFGLVRSRLWDDHSGPTCCLSQPARIYSHETVDQMTKLESVYPQGIIMCNAGIQPGTTRFTEPLG
jgi:hypothetical protein